MHRVELKAYDGIEVTLDYHVPNAPCGVERQFFTYTMTCYTAVPNAPCGVERIFQVQVFTLFRMFLMHRVELKASFEAILFLSLGIVPNAPCGVES